MTRRPHPTMRRLQPLVWLVLLLTGLGLSRSAVLCTRPCCAGHVKLVARCGAGDAGSATEARSCCRSATSCSHDHQGADQREPASHADRDGDCGCHHVRLGVDLSTPPSIEQRLAGPLALRAHRAQPFVAQPGTAPVAPGHPPATGPPPHARRSAHRATIQLLL